jgi:YHS domain-containing protein
MPVGHARPPAIPKPLARFARAHLRTPAQHAVYRIVGSNPDTAWTATEIKHHSALDEQAIDRACRGFAAAGILCDESCLAGGRQYRWRPELRYLLDGSLPAAEAVDPICGVPVDPDSTHRASDAASALAHFCSPYCGAAFHTRSRRT